MLGGSLRPRTAKEQDVTVQVLELEATQTVIGIYEWSREFDISRRVLGRQHIRIRNVKIRVPASCRLPPVVWHRLYTDILKHQHCATAAYDTEEEIVAEACEYDLEPKPIAIERKRSSDVTHDEEWRDASDFRW